MNVVSVVGARPQFIKAAVVDRALRRLPEISPVLIHTGQHYHDRMSNIFFEELDIPEPDYNLDVGSGSHGDQTGRMLIAMERVLSQIDTAAVIVYGDTNSTLAGALAAVKLHVPVLHIEAGLRSFNRFMPEEINRILTDHASDILFAPTERAVANLLREGLPRESIHRVGDVMYDAALFYAERAEAKSSILDNLGISPGCYVLATIHRAENTDDLSRFGVICKTLQEVSRRLPVVFPTHPRTRSILAQSGLSCTDRLLIIDPVGYLDMVVLEKNARIILTDSGGVQKEAFFYQVPCVTFRGETEWVELVELGWNRLAPPLSVDFQMLEIEASLDSQPGAAVANPYGTGTAGESIARMICDQYSNQSQAVFPAVGS